MEAKDVLRKARSIIAKIFEIMFVLFVLMAVAIFWLIGGCMVWSVNTGTDPYITHLIIGIILMIGTTVVFIMKLARYWFLYKGKKEKAEECEYWLGTAIMNSVSCMMVMLPWFWLEKGEPHLAGANFLIGLTIFMTILCIGLLIGSLLKKSWADWRKGNY